MRRGRAYGFLGVIALVGVALLAAPSGAGSSPARVASNSQTYTDSTGEDPQGPDITTITVSNDDAGDITIKVAIPNRPQFTQDQLDFVFIDSDANQATGDPNSFGADYVIQLLGGEAVLFKWDPTTSDYTLASTQSSLSYSWAGGPTFKINASDLSNTRKFNFGVVALSGLVIDPTTNNIDDTNAHRDQAPTIGLYSYEVKITPPTLVVKRFAHAPAQPTAGKPFALQLTVARSDTGAVLQGGTVTCVGRVGSTKLPAQTHRVVNRVAICSWRLPASAKGKTFRGSISITFEGLNAGRSFSGKIH